jgi:ectoine hydroxylase-related dioxygenase (phytanoyl-CoA dioxygenase family)
VHYTATPEDHAAGTLPEGVLDDLRAAISTAGYAVVSNLVSEETRELLLPSILEDAEAVRAGGELTPHEQHTGVGHLQLGLRRYAPYVCADLAANPLIESVVEAVLGQGAWLGFYNGNVNCPGSTYQPLHFDRPYSWKTPEEAKAHGQSWPPPTTTLSCSVALADITLETGATEIYPGSQRETEVATWTTNRLKERPDLVEAWGPPARMEIPAGSVCFRDPRMWHRGVPNHSDRPRAMLGLTYHSALANHWRGRLVHDASDEKNEQIRANPALKLLDDGELGDGRLVFHASARSAFATESIHGVNRNVKFVAEEVNHLLDAHTRGGARVGAAE